MARKGTSRKPFAVGEVVFVRRLGRRGVVARVYHETLRLRMEWPCARIRYAVNFGDDEEETFSAREVEEAERWKPELT